MAAVESQEKAEKGIHAKNRIGRARASIGAAKDYVDLVLTSKDHFEAAQRTWADLPQEVCPARTQTLAATKRYLRGYTTAALACDVLAACLVLHKCKWLYPHAALKKILQLTRHPLLAQVAFAMTVGAHALLNTRGNDVAQLLMGMERLSEICVRAVARWEVQCFACTFFHGPCHAFLAMGPCSTLRTCMQRRHMPMQRHMLLHQPLIYTPSRFSALPAPSANTRELPSAGLLGELHL